MSDQVLVIDDEAAVNNNIRKILGKKGYAVDQALTKAEALEQIEKRSDEVVFGLTWTRGEGTFAPRVLQNLLGSDRTGARYFVSHTGSEIGVQHVPGKNLVVIKKPRYLVAALIRPHATEFELHIVAES